MSLSLLRHPESRGGDQFGVEVEVTRPRRDQISLRYAATGDMQDLQLLSARQPRRAEELWRRTCFEAFLRSETGGYFELNISPLTDWAAYRLTGYREGLAATEVLAPRELNCTGRGGLHRLEAIVDVLVGADLPPDRPWRLGLSAVLEHADGGRSYWALAHPAAKPDFHHPDSFVLDLPPPALPPTDRP